MSAELLLVSWERSFGRMGSLEGLFICTQEEIDKAIGEFVYFGEVLGKHSDISCILKKEDFTIISNDQEKVTWLLSIMGSTISGFCPLNYIETEDEDEEDDDGWESDEDYQGEL